MKDFRDLKVWQKAHVFVLDVYRATKEFPREEQYGLTNQLRRAALSITSNIAEGCGRGTDADFARFLQIAMGSASETECQIILAGDLEYLPAERTNSLLIKVAEVKRMLASLIVAVQAER